MILTAHPGRSGKLLAECKGGFVTYRGDRKWKEHRVAVRYECAAPFPVRPNRSRKWGSA